MEEIIQSLMMYTYGYDKNKVNVDNILIKKEGQIIRDCSIPDEIFDTENITLIDRIHTPQENNNNNIVKPIVEFIIKDKDCLFWAFYIMINGLEKYSQIEIKNIVCEKRERLYLVDNVIQKKTTFLKENKIRITKHIIQNLAYEEKINFQTFQVLCLLHNISFIIKYKKCYYEYKCPNISQENDIIVKHPIVIELRECKKNRVLVLNLDKNIDHDAFVNENVDVSSAIGFTCYYKWTGIKKKISKQFLSYADEINTLGSFFQSNT